MDARMKMGLWKPAEPLTGVALAFVRKQLWDVWQAGISNPSSQKGRSQKQKSPIYGRLLVTR